jgi:hypothetical protein
VHPKFTVIVFHNVQFTATPPSNASTFTELRYAVSRTKS